MEKSTIRGAEKTNSSEINVVRHIEPELPDGPAKPIEGASIYGQELRRGIKPFMSLTMCFANTAVIPSLFLQTHYGL